MKSEHRHELAENDLSKLLSRVLDEHLNKILWGIIVAGFAAAAVIFWNRSSANTRSNAWTQLAASQSAEDYEAIADAFPRSEAAVWARLRAADMHLRQGISQSTSDRPTSTDELALAQKGFDSLLKDSSVPAEVREQALNGLAITLESQSGSDTSDAIAAYEQLLKEFPQSRFAGFASDRIDALKTGRVQEFYAWFQAQNPKPSDMPLPQDGGLKSGTIPGLGEPSGSGTSSLEDLLKAAGAGVAESPETDVNPFPKPLTGETSPEDPKPEGENPFPPPLSTTNPTSDSAPPAASESAPAGEEKPQDAPPETPPAESKDDSLPAPESTPDKSESEAPAPQE